MNLFNIGAGEFFLILILAMIIFGPERLPEVARKAGEAVRSLRKMIANLDPELLQDFREITQDISSVRAEVDTLRSDVAGLQSELQSAASEVSQELGEAVQAIQEESAEAAAAITASGASGNVSGASAGAALGAAQTARVAAGGSGSADSVVSGGGVGGSAMEPRTVQAGAGELAAAPDVAEFPEIIGYRVPLDGKTVGIHFDEIVGEKIYPLPRSAPKPEAEGNGHARNVRLCSRDALMGRLARGRFVAQRRVTPLAKRMPPRSVTVGLRSRRVRGG